MFQNKDLVTIAALTFITVLAWIVFDVYHAAVTTTVTEVQSRLILPMNPRFDPNTISQIRQRVQAP